MKKRGRKPKDDSELILAVSDAAARGLTVKEACAEIWEQRGRAGPNPEQLRKRYEQFKSHYLWSDPTKIYVYDRRSLLARMFSKPGFQRMLAGGLALSRKAANKKRAVQERKINNQK